MHKKAKAIPVLFKGTPSKLWVALFLLLSLVVGTVGIITQRAQAATSSTINFQARLLQANGGVVPDGYYNIEFKLYDVSTSGSALWTETRYDSNGATAGNDNRVRVANGYVTVNLGSVNAFPNINWDQELWLTMNIGGTAQTASPSWDGEMNPRLKFTASPYSFASGKLQVSAGANTSTLGFGAQTASRSLLLPDESGTLCVQGSAGCGFAAASGSNSYIQNNALSPQNADFNISGKGTLGGGLNLPGIDGVDSGILFGGDTTLYSPATGFLKTDGRFEAGNRITANDDTANEVTVGMTAVGTLGAGITFGSAQDTNLYRSAPNTLKTDDALVVAGALSVTSSANSYIMGALGLGTASPQTGSALTIANASWISAVDAAGTGYLNLFQANANNEIQVGAAMNIDGGIILPTNGGQLTLADMPLDSTSSAGTVHGYTMCIGTTNALTVYGQSDGAGGAQNVRVAIGSGITPGYVLDVTGDINSSTALRVAGTSVCTSSGCTPASGSANYIQNTSSQQASSNFNISGTGTIGTSLAVNGSTGITTAATSVGLFNTTATTVNFAGAATTLNVGAASGTANFNGRVNIGGTVSARLAVTATNNSESALYVRTTNGVGYGNALQVTNGTTDYMTIGAYGAVTFNLASSANVAQAYRFNTGPNGAGILLDMNAQQQTVGIAKAASTTYTLDVNGSTNATNYYRSGTLLNSSHLSDYTSLARLNTTNTLTSSSAFIVTNGTTTGIIVDTQNDRVGIGTSGAPGNYTLDVGGKFMVDKPNNRVIVGTWGGDTSGTVTVLGNKTTSGDPAGTLGAMYYNVQTEAFRCYTSNGWHSCGPRIRKLDVDVSTSSTSMASVSTLGFLLNEGIDYSLKCDLVYQSEAPTTGMVFTLNGLGFTQFAGTFDTMGGASVSTPVGYGFNSNDGGVGIASVPVASTNYYGVLNAVVKSTDDTGALLFRYKSLVAGSAITLKAGSSCQLTAL